MAKKTFNEAPGAALPAGAQQQAPPTPYIHPSVGASPVAAAYRANLQARKHMPPVAGGPTPPIPHLDHPHVDGRTMAEQAAQMAVGATAPAGVDPQMDSIISQYAPNALPGGVPASGASPVRANLGTGILPQDTLPPNATEDPTFRPGPGSMYASAQPWLVKKYGVIRGGQHLPPQALFAQPAGAKLRPETAAGLQHVLEFQKQAADAAGASTPSPEQLAENDASKSASGAAARLNNAPGDTTTRAATKEEREEAQRLATQMDDFDFDNFRQMMMRDLINNEEQRKIIESRCSKMDIADIITQNHVRQVVPIVPNKFYPEFESMSAEDDLAIKRLLMEEARTVEIKDRYLLDKFAYMAVVVGLYKLNGNPLPSHRDEQGNFDDKKFWVKFNRTIKLPVPVMASLGVNYFWFDIRVRKLCVAENLGNG